MQVVCECLRQAPHYELLEYFATRRSSTGKNAFVLYYQIFARAEGSWIKYRSGLQPAGKRLAAGSSRQGPAPPP